MASKAGFLSRIKSAVIPVAVHGIGMLTAILFLAASEALLKATMGPNAVFFGAIPISYVIQVGDLLVLGRFLRLAWKEFRDA